MDESPAPLTCQALAGVPGFVFSHATGLVGGLHASACAAEGAPAASPTRTASARSNFLIGPPEIPCSPPVSALRSKLIKPRTARHQANFRPAIMRFLGLTLRTASGSALDVWKAARANLGVDPGLWGPAGSPAHPPSIHSVHLARGLNIASEGWRGWTSVAHSAFVIRLTHAPA